MHPVTIKDTALPQFVYSLLRSSAHEPEVHGNNARMNSARSHLHLALARFSEEAQRTEANQLF
jgi:hypothetical protein